MESENQKLTWKGRLIATVFGLLLLAIVSEGILRIVMPNWQDFYSTRFMKRVMVPGYGTVSTGKPGFNGFFAQNNGDFRVHIKINEFGLRNSEPVNKSDNRTWIIGDSMAFGWGVEQNEMYSSVLGRELGIQTYNVASPGTNLCGYQALASRMPKSVVPTAVIIGLILENDMKLYDCRREARKREERFKAGKAYSPHVVTWIAAKQFLTKHLALYNFVVVTVKRIHFVRDLLSNIGLIRKPTSYVKFLYGENLQKVSEKSIDEIEVLKNMLPDNIPIIILIAPGRFELLNNDKVYKDLRLSVRSELTKRKILYVDPFRKFKETGFNNIHFAHDGHWTALGHKIAAEEIAKVLKSNN
jgi:lysophospholipase L1-like esterase